MDIGTEDYPIRGGCEGFRQGKEAVCVGTRAAVPELSCSAPGVVPATAHFIWLGPSFPWVNMLAIQSALRAGGFERAILHHDSDLSATRWWGELTDERGFEARALDPQAVFAASGVDANGLLSRYRTLSAPSAKANMLRAAILSAEGGVYLDMDTVTVRTLTPLRQSCGFFVGEELIAFPGVGRVTLPLRARGWGLTVLRQLFRYTPRGYRGFRRVAPLFHRAVNNAVLGSAPGHPFVRSLLERMLRLPDAQARVRFALGTHLLQAAIADEATAHGDLKVLPPRYFYPLAPEISDHWFRLAAEPELKDVLSPDCAVVHWYASIRTSQVANRIDPAYVRAHTDRQLFSKLAGQACGIV